MGEEGGIDETAQRVEARVATPAAAIVLDGDFIMDVVIPTGARW